MRGSHEGGVRRAVRAGEGMEGGGLVVPRRLREQRGANGGTGMPLPSSNHQLLLESDANEPELSNPSPELIVAAQATSPAVVAVMLASEQLREERAASALLREELAAARREARQVASIAHQRSPICSEGAPVEGPLFCPDWDPGVMWCSQPPCTYWIV